MKKFGPKYGFTEKEVNQLAQIWKTKDLGGQGWKDFDAFLRWSSAFGWRSHCRLGKESPLSPHGPRNSYWTRPDGSTDGMYSPYSPCRNCESSEKCEHSCKERIAYFDRHMAAIRRSYGL